MVNWVLQHSVWKEVGVSPPFHPPTTWQADFPIPKPFLTDVVKSSLNKTSPVTDSAVQISQHLSSP